MRSGQRDAALTPRAALGLASLCCPQSATFRSTWRKRMSEVTVTAPEGTSAAGKARALLPEISSQVEAIEQARAVSRDLMEKLRSAGVFRRYVPRSHGGDEMWPDEGLTVIEELARADASVAWVAAVGSEGPSFYAYLPGETYDKIYSAGPDVIHSGVINPTGRAVRDGNGYRFSGRWS